MNKQKTCLYCGEEFNPTHKNQLYCPEKNCSYSAKLERQNAEYQIGDDAKKAIQKNVELFEMLLGNEKQLEFDIVELEKKGFNQFGYFGTHLSNNIICHRVNNFYFWITNKNKITLWKQS